MYFYSYALNDLQVQEETRLFLNTIRPYKEKIFYPAIIDMEDADGYKEKNGMPSNEMLVKMCDTACSMIGSEGYFSMIYASQSWFMGRLRSDKLKKYAKWIAWWYEKAKIDTKEYLIWQKSNKGKIEGINGNVDINEAFIDFPLQIKYLQMIVKIQQIKMITGLADITLQYLNCYKYNDDLMKKLFNRLQKPKLKQCNFSATDYDKWDLIQEEFEFERKTIEFMQFYLYSDDLRDKLYASIVE